MTGPAAVPAPARPHIVLVVGGGSAPTPLDAARWPGPDVVIAADSGVDHALAAGLRIDRVVGDLDSASDAGLAAARSQGAVVERFAPDKDETDLELALDRAHALRPDRVVVTGLSGGRTDHFLANVLLATSPRYADTIVDIVSGSDRMFVVHSSRTIEARAGETLTLLPIHGSATGVTTSGLDYPLDDEPLAAGSPRGVSNVVSTGPVTVTVRSGTLLAILADETTR